MIKTPLSTMIGGAFWTPSATILGGTSKTFDQLIKSLFANGEQGFAYDTNDLSTMFQNAAGTIPVTGAGQPVGLMKDKSGRNNHAYQTTSAARPIVAARPILGVELIVDPYFSDATKWQNSPSVTIANGLATFSGATTGNYLRAPHLTVLGRKYLVSIDIASITSGVLRIAVSTGIGSALAPDISAAGKYVFEQVASGATPTFQITAIGTTNATIRSVFIKEVLAYDNNSKYVSFDAADDKLVTTLPTQLTGCTVVRSVPNAGTQILTNQTIPTTYNDNTDHCGLIVINRTLTATETSQITKLFNKAAGV